ncbi:MAG: molybdopterin-dependent oxidoreductase [Coriobacteriales bacterium]|nr:molybdopterin-dependent oxidoreductase [Coriobacteriales bacterium]
MSSLSMSRRGFVKAAALTGAAAALSNIKPLKALATETVDFVLKEDGDTKVIRTACRGCGKFECGVLVTVKNGRAIKIEGDTSYPGGMGNCCAKSQASLQATYHPMRLTYPMMRTTPKGENPEWKRVSWEEAIATACAKLDEIQEKYGGAAIAFFGGTSRIYAMSGMSAMAYLYDSPNAVSPAQVCKGPRGTVAAAASGSGNELYFVENVWRPDVFTQWGSGIEVSNYDDPGRVAVDNAMHAQAYINVDARMSNMAKEAKALDKGYFLAPRPGTDGAIAMAWAKIIIEEELFDAWYCKRWTDCAFLVCEEMEPTGVSGEQYFQVGLTGTTPATRNYTTNLLKECDVDPAMLPWKVEGEGDPHHFIVWDAANQRFTYLDSFSGLWEGEAEFKPKYVPGSEWYMQKADREPARNEVQEKTLWEMYDWEEVKGQWVQSGRPGIAPVFLPDPDDMPTVEGCEFPTDPALFSDGGFDITLKDGRKVKCRTVMEHYYDNAEEWTPEHAEEVTGVKAQLIVDACHAYAHHYDPASGTFNGAINFAVTHEHTGNACKVIHTMEALDALMGNMDVPGGHRGATPAESVNTDQTTRITGQFLRVGDKNRVTDPEQAARAMKKPFQSGDATTVYRAMQTGDPYRIYGGLVQAGGILNQSNILEAYEGVKNMEFFVEANLWEDAISSLADVLLPEQTWMEIPGCTRIAQGSNGFYGAHIHCVDAPGEAKYGIDWVAEWYKQKGVPFWTTRAEGEDEWEMGDFLRDKAVQSTGKTWAEFAEEFEKNGWFDARVTNPNGYGCCRRYMTGWLCKPFEGRPGFKTNTSRHEVWSTQFENAMRNVTELCTGEKYGTKYALPYYTEPKSSPNGGGGYVEVQGNNPDNPNHEKIASYTFDKYPYIASTGRRIPVYFHTEHRQLPWCREAWPVPRMEINPVDAEQLGLENGDWAWIETPFAKIRQCVDINMAVGVGRVNLEHSWWFPELNQPGHGFELSGCNCLVDSFAQCEAKGSPQLRGYLVNIYKATPENSPFNNPVPCGEDGTPIITSADDPRLKEWAPTYEGRA